MSHPPQRQKKHHQIAIEMVRIAELAAFNVPPSTFGILKSGFYPHAPSIHFDEFSRGRQIRNHDPDFFIAWLPTDRQGGSKAMLFPNHPFAVPLLPFFEHKLSDRLPGGATPLELATNQMLLRNAQHVMPVNGLADPNQFEATEPTISQQGAVGRREERSHLRKQLAHQLPLSLLPRRLLRHNLPGQRQYPVMNHQSQVDDGKIIVVRSTVEHQNHLFVLPKGRDV